MTQSLRFVALLVAIAFICTSAVHAGSREDCSDVDVDVRILGCSAFIDEGTASPRILAFAYFNLAQSYHAKGDFDRAVANYKKAISYKHRVEDAYNGIGFISLRKGDADNAFLAFNKALELNSRSWQAHLGFGYYKFRIGDFGGALAELNVSISLQPKYAPSFEARGQANEHLGNLLAAVADYRKALTLDPTNKVAIEALGRIGKLEQL